MSKNSITLRPNSGRLWRVLSVLAVLVLWEIFGKQQPVFMSYPTEILRAAWETLVEDRTLVEAFAVTLQAFGVGYIAAIVVGTVIGYLMCQSEILDFALGPYVRALYTLPRIALIPLLILFVGIGYRLRVTIVFLAAVLSIIIVVRDGGAQVADNFKDVARSLVASRWQTWRTIILPGSVPSLFAAYRLGAQRALVAVIVAETLAGAAGTGRVINDYARYYLTDKLMVPVLIIGFFSILLTVLLNWIRAAAAPHERLTQQGEAH